MAEGLKGMTKNNLKDQIKALAESQGLTFKELAVKADMNENGLHDKFRRESLTVKDLNKLLNVLGKTIDITDIDKDKK